jgi:lipopolysaccharide/colanic/teichoic acid biosynthesis glycosyltransferase
MSFIGPRPERPFFVTEYERSVAGYAQRHKVKPGITGLAQVNGFYDTDAGNKLKYDIYYIHNYSLWLDLMIVLATLKTMITRRGT